MLTHAKADINTHPVGPRSALVGSLTDAYWGEIQTASKYVMSSTNRVGIRAAHTGRCLRTAIACNLDHAQRLALRIKQLHGLVPGPDEFAARALRLGPPEDPLDDRSVLSGVIEAEVAAINRYRRIIAMLDPVDWITHDMVSELIGEKLTLRRQLESHLSDSDKP